MRRARLIAFYLPQYHPIPENDEWWGKGFTDWRNVAKAKPVFRGHEQPKIPADLGFYDLRVPEVRAQQADLAQKYGIEGFCYWHYWFNGKLLLERPINEIIASGEPDFPFCLAWANEPWTRAWDGKPRDILLDQVYGGDDDDRRHFEWLLPALTDRRAIRVDGKPVFCVYKAKNLPECRRTTELWRNLAAKNGLPGLYLLSVETDGTFGWDARQGGFDAAIDYQPRWERIVAYMKKNLFKLAVDFLRYHDMHLWILDYGKVWPHLIAPAVDYPLYPGVCPRWDNTPRRVTRGIILKAEDSGEYGAWLGNAVRSVQHLHPDHRLVFINAWNEWAEGNYLEPDLLHGHEYLDATARAVMG
jgi:lipopolysaccharide biosynthesis protein